MAAVSGDVVAVVGLGAVGTVVAGALAEAGHPVVVCGRRPLDHIEVTDDRGTRTHQVRWVGEPAEADQAPWVFLATKIHQTADVAPWLRAAAGPDSHLVVLQNGVDHVERVGALVGDTTVVPALVYVNAERTGTGSARARHTAERDLVMPDDPDGWATAGLFDDTPLNAVTVTDFRTAAWHKLLTNAAANPITALTGRRVEVLREPDVADLATAVLRETVAVGRAVGADLPDDSVTDALGWLQGLAPGTPSSMLQDREAGRPLEYDGLTGAVVRLADRHGVPAPTSRAFLALLSALPSG